MLFIIAKIEIKSSYNDTNTNLNVFIFNMITKEVIKWEWNILAVN